MRTATTRRNGIPVTTPARTIADLKRVLPDRQVGRAIREAQVLGLPLGDEIEPEPTRSELEGRFLALLRRHRLAKPLVNVRVDGFEVDFLWPERRLIVEVDGFRYHGTRSGFEADRERDARLTAGHDVIRFTYRQITEDPAHGIETLRALL